LPGKNTAKQMTIGTNATQQTLEIFYIGLDDVLYHAWQHYAGTAFTVQNYLDTPATKAVALSVARNQSGALELFYIGMDGVLYHNWQLPKGGWHGQAKM